MAQWLGYVSMRRAPTNLHKHCESPNGPSALWQGKDSILKAITNTANWMRHRRSAALHTTRARRSSITSSQFGAPDELMDDKQRQLVLESPT